MEKGQGPPPAMQSTLESPAPPYPGPPVQPVPAVYTAQPQPVVQPGKTSGTFTCVILPTYFSVLL